MEDNNKTSKTYFYIEDMDAEDPKKSTYPVYITDDF